MTSRISVKWILDPIADLVKAIFSPIKEEKFPWLAFVWIGILVIAGALLWCVFLNWGNVPFDFMDWGEVWAARQQAWRVALQNNTLPFHLDDLSAMRTVNDRYFSIADMVSSPQVILLRWLEVGPFTLVNQLLFYGIATISLLIIRKRYGLSLFSFTVLFLLFHFNGYMPVHLAVGHLCWNGYYLFPAFTLLLLELNNSRVGWRWVANMAFLLFFMFMQGSFHHLIWCFIALGFTAALRWRHFASIAKAILGTILLSTPRILPALVFVKTSRDQIDFLGGYPSFGSLIHALVYNSTPDMAKPLDVFEHSLGYWEFDAYVSLQGLLFLSVFGIIFLLVWHYRKKDFPTQLMAALFLAFLSINDNFLRVVFYNPILASSERATSRMFGLALVILIILAVLYYQKSSNTWRLPLWTYPLQLAWLAWLSYDLVLHTLRWSIKNVHTVFQRDMRDLASLQITNHPDPQYYAMLGYGVAITLVTAAILIWLARKESPTKRDGLI